MAHVRDFLNQLNKIFEFLFWFYLSKSHYFINLTTKITKNI